MCEESPSNPDAGPPRPGYSSLTNADEPNFIPGVAASTSVRQPAKPAGPPKKWPHTFNYNVPPQGQCSELISTTSTQCPQSKALPAARFIATHDTIDMHAGKVTANFSGYLRIYCLVLPPFQGIASEFALNYIVSRRHTSSVAAMLFVHHMGPMCTTCWQGGGG